MQIKILRFPSVTYAQKALRLLAEEGIAARLTRKDLRGCSFGLAVSPSEAERAEKILSEKGLRILH